MGRGVQNISIGIVGIFSFLMYAVCDTAVNIDSHAQDCTILIAAVGFA
jgi:hypothetical protein